jgi:anti-sigma factor RsiW
VNCDQVRDLAAGYVLGALEPSEERAVREHLASCPEPHEEFAELGSVVPALAEAVELVQPPASLKERVMAAAAADLAARQEGGRTAGAAERMMTFPTAEEREQRAARRTSGVTWLLRIAAVLAIVALAASNAYLLTRPQPTDVAFREAVDRVVAAAAEEGSVTAVLQPQAEGGPRGIAAVTADGSIVLAMHGLAPTAGTEVYEAWVIAGASPIPVGEFRVGADGTGVATLTGTPAEAGVTLALTREPGPDSTTPTDPILSVGVAGSG